MLLLQHRLHLSPACMFSFPLQLPHLFLQKSLFGNVEPAEILKQFNIRAPWGFLGTELSTPPPTVTQSVTGHSNSLSLIPSPIKQQQKRNNRMFSADLQQGRATPENAGIIRLNLKFRCAHKQHSPFKMHWKKMRANIHMPRSVQYPILIIFLLLSPNSFV